MPGAQDVKGETPTEAQWFCGVGGCPALVFVYLFITVYLSTFILFSSISLSAHHRGDRCGRRRTAAGAGRCSNCYLLPVSNGSSRPHLVALPVLSKGQRLPSKECVGGWVTVLSHNV